MICHGRHVNSPADLSVKLTLNFNFRRKVTSNNTASIMDKLLTLYLKCLLKLHHLTTLLMMPVRKYFWNTPVSKTMLYGQCLTDFKKCCAVGVLNNI